MPPQTHTCATALGACAAVVEKSRNRRGEPVGDVVA